MNAGMAVSSECGTPRRQLDPHGRHSLNVMRRSSSFLLLTSHSSWSRLQPPADSCSRSVTTRRWSSLRCHQRDEHQGSKAKERPTVS